MGLPRFWGRVEGPPPIVLGDGGDDEEDIPVPSQDTVRGKEDIEMSPRKPRSSAFLTPNAAHDRDGQRARSTGRSHPLDSNGRAKSRSRTRANGTSNGGGGRSANVVAPSRTQARNRAHAVVTGRLGLGWSVAYYILLLAGAVGFWMMFWRLTESEHALVQIDRVGGGGGRGKAKAGMKAVEGARRRWGW